MKSLLLSASMGLVLLAPAAFAEEAVETWVCSEANPVQPLPFGDREGHMLAKVDVVCQITSGPLAGGIASYVDYWEWDGPKGVKVASAGSARKMDAMAVWGGGTGKIELTMSEGKVTGWIATGTGENTLATGAWSKLNGKKNKWTAKSAKIGFTVELKWE